MKLLIVEDDAKVRRVIRRVVEDLAEEVRECSDGAEAVEAYRRWRPDWVLMDIEMEGTDGLAATRRIHELAPAARVLIVTNYDGADLRAAAREAGAADYVVKENMLDIRKVLLGESRVAG